MAQKWTRFLFKRSCYVCVSVFIAGACGNEMKGKQTQRENEIIAENCKICKRELLQAIHQHTSNAYLRGGEQSMRAHMQWIKGSRIDTYNCALFYSLSHCMRESLSCAIKYT
jgi:hypothetical protein